MPRQPCIECRRRPPHGNRRRCSTCQLRHEPVGDQVAAARRRLAMVPEELRVKRGKKVQALAPQGAAWCAGCQSFRDHEDFGKGATTCRACASARQHGAMVAKTYGLSAEQYDDLLKLQGGKCAICRARPKSKRLAVDHDHDSGAVRGLLCSRCNHDLMGAAWDSAAMAAALWHYMNTPPARGGWLPPEQQGQLVVEGAQRPPKGLGAEPAPFATRAGSGGSRPQGAPVVTDSSPRDEAEAILAGIAPDVRTAHALWFALSEHLHRVDPAPF